ncbi:MAG: NAD+ synthase [Chlamydiae bacterium]|nr:NAD+ synthase [Chlamydiota bacterium]
MKILLAQMNPKIGDLEGNAQKIIETISRGKKEGVDLVVFPELALCGYPPQDLLFHQIFIDEMERCLEGIVKACAGISCMVGCARRNVLYGERKLFNSVAVVRQGVLLGFQDKWLLPMYDVFNERRYFEPGREIHLWDIQGVKVGVTICEDMWPHAGYGETTHYDRDPIDELAFLKPDVMINASASPYQSHKIGTRLDVGRKAAVALGCPVVICCQVGANDQIIFDGHSACFNAAGELCLLAKGFEEDACLLDTEKMPGRCDYKENLSQEMLDALKLGIRDYFKKSCFDTACLGISGGIDSALVAYLAKEALGKEHVIGVWMPSPYSSKESEEDTFLLCKNLDIACITLPIEESFRSLLRTLMPPFVGKQEDITEENLQARLRGVLLMALSNKHGYLVLSTGNKSELAMGYCTLYGDMCGGLSVIGDVLKTQVYALTRYINKQAKRDLIPQRIIDKPPSAELKPFQKDLDSLPDYGIVDHVLRGYVEEYLKPDVISQKYDISMDVVKDLIQKIHRAEYKRRQGPPTLRVSKKSFGVGRQYPIVQGFDPFSHPS